MFDLNGEQVSTLHGHWSTDFTQHVRMLADAYGRNRVFIVGEAAKEGIPVLRSLYDAAYWLYYHRAEQTKGRVARDMLGHVPVQWDPTVRKLQAAIGGPEAGRPKLHDEELHRQLCKFGYRPKSSAMSSEEATESRHLIWGPPPGEHDDLVRAAALGWAGIEWLPRFAPPKVELPPDSIGRLVGWDQLGVTEEKKSIWA
jgi:hypothetical protein